MTQYWPVAIVKAEDGYERLSTYDSADTFIQAEKQFEIWSDNYGYKLIGWWIDIISDDGKRDKSYTRYDADALQELINFFGKVPVDHETDCIKEWFGEFSPGTNRGEIMRWFEDAFNLTFVFTTTR